MSGHCCCCKLIKVAGKLARIAAWLPSTGWTLHNKGYLIYTSRAVKTSIKRGARAHRVAVEKLLGCPIPEDKHVHHQDFDKLNNCPRNLIMLDSLFNPTFAMRDPYTGEYMSPSDWHRRYGYKIPPPESIEDLPDWVTADGPEVHVQYIERKYATAGD